jgi:glutamate carboxypeptidase
MFKVTLIALALFGTHAALAATLSAREARVAAAVDADQGRNVALLEKLVNINSGTFNLAGVSHVAAELEAEFKVLGFNTRLIDQSAVKRAPSLLATHHGGRGKRVLLLGHMDTVFEPSSPVQRMTREGERAAGPGVNDMKGGLVVNMGALRALKQAGGLAKADLFEATQWSLARQADRATPGQGISLVCSATDPQQHTPARVSAGGWS